MGLEIKLKAGDKISIKLSPQSGEALESDDDPIAVYSIQKDNLNIFSVEQYNNANSLRDKRINLLLLISGALILGRGLNIIPRKASWLIAG